MKKKVLFLCPGNSCHSQMAEGLLKHFYGDEYDVFSAGLNPIEVSKNVIEVMNEIGIDISNQTSKHINDFLNDHFDIIITVCDETNESLPALTAEAEKVRWDFFYPMEALETQKDLPKALRALRDDIKEKVLEHFRPH